MEDDLPWKTTSKMKDRNISATTGLSFSKFELRLKRHAKYYGNLICRRPAMEDTLQWKTSKMKNRNISASTGLNFSKFENLA
jgi:hypothetical protein